MNKSFEKLLDTKVKCEAVIADISKTQTGLQRVLLNDVFVNGTYLRDHTFMKHSKRWKSCKIGDTVTFTAELRNYVHKGVEKLGLGSSRFIVVV